MFNFFKKDSGVKVLDKVWMAKYGKWSACAGLLQANPSCLFVAWFDETLRELKDFLHLPEGHSSLILASYAEPTQTENRMVVFVEHYPVRSVEQALFEKLKLKEVPVLSSMDEPIYEKFNGARIVELMKKMGIHENESVSHSAVTASLKRLQGAIQEQITSDIKAPSQAEWFIRNRRN